MEDIERGRIVWVTNLTDTQGNPTEDHRGIILTTNADYQAGKRIKVAIISSKLNYTTADRMVILNYLKRPGGHPQTGLDRPSAVICDWTPFVDEDDITSYGNIIYGKVLLEIIQKSTQSQASTE